MKSKFLYLCVGLMISSKALCQNDSAAYYIRKLDWTSFKETVGYSAQLLTGEAIERLIKLDDPQKIDLLVESLDDTTKTVALHIVLTKIFEPLYNRFGSSAESGKLSTIIYMYNNLYWTRTYDENNRQIGCVKLSEVKSIIQYWKIILEIKSRWHW